MADINDIPLTATSNSMIAGPTIIPQPAPLARYEPQGSAIVERRRPELAFSPEQEQLIRDTFANGASAQEFAVLMEIARARRLNPFLRQIHFVKRWNSQLRRDVWSAQASIDGLRGIAEDSGKYGGQDEPEFEYGEEKTAKNPNGIRLCRVRVYRKDWQRPCVGVAHWAEFVQTNRDGHLTAFWRDKGHVMIAKCAEALALRKAHPEEMAGLYVPEEMGQDPIPEIEPRKPGSGAAGPGTRISPHDHPDDPDDPTRELDAVFADLLRELHDLEEAVAKVTRYDEALTLRQLLGSKAARSELTKRIQSAREEQRIGSAQHQELGRTWQRIDRQLTRATKELTPDAAASFTDPDELPDQEYNAGRPL